ncbi:DNA-directed RNA polymerase II subunit RPB1 [Hordeum vulgare]|nr:DNA-directed RNA polymerase II subunit RPB1 [Hordeum vulgare]
MHAKIKDARAKIFQATSKSRMQPTSKKAAEAMEHLLPHEVAEREMEMREVEEIEERQEEEFCVAEEEVEKSLSVKESAVEYQCEL